MTSPIDAALQKNKILSQLHPLANKSIQGKIYIFETIDSTNVEAKRIQKRKTETLHGTVVLAEHQTAGKGRLGRKFYSPQGMGVYLSIVCQDAEFSKVQNDAVSITVSTAVAVRRSLKEFGVRANIKWVNDLFVGNKKVCGILVEGVFASSESGVVGIDNYIIGIGINVLEAKEGFPEELKAIAGSLEKNIDRNTLIASVLNNFFAVLTESPKTIIEEYRKHSMIINEIVTVVTPNESYSAKVLEINDAAHLIVQREDGTKETLVSGEISLRL